MSRVSELLDPNAYMGREQEPCLMVQSGPEPETVVQTEMAEGFPVRRCAAPRKYTVANKSLSMGQFARMANSLYGVCLGRQKLYNYFRREGVIPFDSRVPRREYLAEGLFDVVASKKMTPYGPEPVTLITPKGQRYYIASILKEFQAGA